MSTPVEPIEPVETPAEEAQTEVTDTTPEGADALGDPGKKALDAMKDKWHIERDKRRALEEEIASLRAPKKEETTDQPDADAIRNQALAEARTEFAIKLEAKGRLENPNAAQRFPEYFKDVKDGDAAAVKAAVDELLEDHPYLAAATAKRFQGSGDGGARKASGPAQLTRDDLKRMSHKEIVKAREEGRLSDLLNPKN